MSWRDQYRREQLEQSNFRHWFGSFNAPTPNELALAWIIASDLGRMPSEQEVAGIVADVCRKASPLVGW